MNRILTSCLLIAASLAGSGPGIAAEASVVPRSVKSLHILFVFDDNGSFSENLGVTQDKKNWMETFAAIGANLNLKPGEDFTLELLEGDRVTPGEIRQYYRSLNPRPGEDGLVFVYSGHGTYNDRAGHILALHDQPILRDEVRQLMRSKNPALSVLITDCCGERAPVLPKFYDIPDEPKGQMMCASLFYFHRGEVDINSSEMGKPAYGHEKTGGNFSHAFRRLLYGARMNSDAAEKSLRLIDREDRWNDVTWNQFAKLLKEETLSVSREFNDGEQSPHVFSLPGGYLGLHGRALSPEGKPDGLNGILVQDVHPGSPAAAVGISSFDLQLKPVRKINAELVVGINGIPVREIRDFEQIIDRSNGRIRVELLDPISNRRWFHEIQLANHKQ